MWTYFIGKTFLGMGKSFDVESITWFLRGVKVLNDVILYKTRSILSERRQCVGKVSCKRETFLY
jgi:hypothetical protein